MAKQLQKYERKAETEQKLAELIPEINEATEKHEQVSNVTTEYYVGKNTKITIHEPKKQRTVVKFERNPNLTPIAFIDKELAIYFDVEKAKIFSINFNRKTFQEEPCSTKIKHCGC